jgi:hypothetical protein
MIMRFRGGGVGHTSTRAATNVFKGDRAVLDHDQGAPIVNEPYNVEEQDDEEDNGDIISEDSEAEIDEGELSESEMADYGYELEDDSGEEDEEEEAEGEGGEEDDTTIDELDILGYADY